MFKVDTRRQKGWCVTLCVSVHVGDKGPRAAHTPLGRAAGRPLHDGFMSWMRLMRGCLPRGLRVVGKRRRRDSSLRRRWEKSSNDFSDIIVGPFQRCLYLIVSCSPLVFQL
jgi:hypothetical protein